jgi:hypothetical protein
MFRFTIRDLLWLMVVMGLSIGWWLNRQTDSLRIYKAEEERHKAIADLEQTAARADVIESVLKLEAETGFALLAQNKLLKERIESTMGGN